MHFAAAPHEIDIVFLKAMDAIAPGLFGRGARAVGRAQDTGDVIVLERDRNDTDAAAEPERTIIPHELEILYGLTEDVGGLHGLVQRTTFQQNAEFIATQPGKRISPSNLGLK